MVTKEQTNFSAHRTGPKAFVASLCLAWMFAANTAMAGIVTIDTFDHPNPGNLYVLASQQTNPAVFVEQEPGILGKEREFQITVNGVPNPLSALGVVMTGEYVFGSASPGAKVIFQYDGDDQPGSGLAPSPNLTNAKLLSKNFGTLNAASNFLIQFMALDSGPTSNHINMQARLYGAGNSTAVYNGQINDNSSPFDYNIPYSAFTTSAGFSFGNVKALEFEFNTTMIPFVDFEIDRISAVPEPSTWVMGLIGLVGFLAAARRKLRG